MQMGKALTICSEEVQCIFQCHPESPAKKQYSGCFQYPFLHGLQTVEDNPEFFAAQRQHQNRCQNGQPRCQPEGQRQSPWCSAFRHHRQETSEVQCRGYGAEIQGEDNPQEKCSDVAWPMKFSPTMRRDLHPSWHIDFYQIQKHGGHHQHERSHNHGHVFLQDKGEPGGGCQPKGQESGDGKIGCHTEDRFIGKSLIWFIASIFRTVIFEKTSTLRKTDRKNYIVPTVIKQLNEIIADKVLTTKKTMQDDTCLLKSRRKY